MIYIFLSDGFEETEALTPADIWRRAGKKVALVSVDGKREVTGSHSITVLSDITIDEVDKTDAEAFFLPGGMPGTLGLGKSEKLKDLLLYGQSKKILLAAICAAPSVLGKYGLLEGRKFTCYDGFEKGIENAEYTHAQVEINYTDSYVVTGIGPGAAADFAFGVLAVLDGNTDAADRIEKSMKYVI